MPPPEKPKAQYVPVKRAGNLLFISGQVPMRNGVAEYIGKVGSERTMEYAIEAARMCTINMLAAIRDYTGDLDKVKDIVKINIYINSETGFDKQHIIGNAASDLLIAVFGESGHHARTAIGTNQLPMDFTVEIEGIIELREDYNEI